MTQITQGLLESAAAYAAEHYGDEWFAVDVSVAGKHSEVGTVIVEYSGIMFEVWLTRYWHNANQTG